MALLGTRSARPARGRRLVWATVAALALAAPVRKAPAEESLEYAVKAAFLLNFAKFAEWPADSPQALSSSVAICVLGRDPFGGVLEEVVAGRTAGGKPIAIRRHQDTPGIEACHIVFVASSECDRLESVFERVGGSPVLTVSECPAFGDRGGMIRLFVEDNRARFEVNLGPAEERRLRLSSKLLGVARPLRAQRKAVR